jgi:hypothetical protein
MGGRMGVVERIAPRVWLFTVALLGLPVAAFTYLRVNPEQDKALVGARLTSSLSPSPR